MDRTELEALREGWDFEAKLAHGRYGTGKIPDSLWETYSAMANTSGGKILLGATERQDGTLEFKGFIDVASIERELWNLLENRQKVSVNLLNQQDVECIEVEGRTLLLLHIPKATRSVRPVFINGSRERGTYLRVHEGDRHAGEEIIRRMIADGIPERDSGVVDDFSLDDLNAESVRGYRAVFAARRGDHAFLPKNDSDFLVAIGAARQLRNSDKIQPTWAGLWMLGHENAIRELLPHWHLSFKELPENRGDSRRWVDRVHPDGTWNANLFEFYLKVIVKLHDGLKVPFAMEQGQFRRDETPIHDAIREALVNTLIHADHQGTTGIRIIKKRSGFEFINPGLLLVTPAQLWRGGVSEPRNPALQRLFGFLNLGEREGSGGPVMRQVWREQHWRAPRISVDIEHTETRLELPLESLLPEEAVHDLIDEWGSRFTEQDELGRIILVTAYIEGSIHHARVRELSEAHPRDITLKFQELMRQRLLDSTGQTRNKIYQLQKPEELPLFTTSKGINTGDTTAANDDTSSANGETSERYDGTSGRYDDTSGRYDDTSALARVQRTKRASPALVHEAILESCTAHFLTAEEIAKAIARSPNTVKNRYVPELVKQGKLEVRYPDTPNHPAQAYRTHR